MDGSAFHAEQRPRPVDHGLQDAAQILVHRERLRRLVQGLELSGAAEALLEQARVLEGGGRLVRERLVHIHAAGFEEVGPVAVQGQDAEGTVPADEREGAADPKAVGREPGGLVRPEVLVRPGDDDGESGAQRAGGRTVRVGGGIPPQAELLGVLLLGRGGAEDVQRPVGGGVADPG